MGLKSSRREEVFSKVHKTLSLPDFKISDIRPELMLLLDDEGFFEQMSSCLMHGNDVLKLNALRVIVFMIITNKIDVQSPENSEAIDVCKMLMQENNITADLATVLERI